MLKVSHITKTLSGRKVLDDVDFTIADGEVCGLLAQNGEGKTTLFRTLIGAYSADSGSVETTARISYLPEQIALPTEQKAIDYLLYIARLRGMKKNVAMRNISTLAEKFSLQQFMKFYIGNLSKGMQQKVQFLSVIVNQPKVLLLDEPFSGLDENNIALFKSEIQNLKSIGSSILLSAHSQEKVNDVCDRFIQLSK